MYLNSNYGLHFRFNAFHHLSQPIKKRKKPTGNLKEPTDLTDGSSTDKKIVGKKHIEPLQLKAFNPVGLSFTFQKSAALEK